MKRSTKIGTSSSGQSHGLFTFSNIAIGKAQIVPTHSRIGTHGNSGFSLVEVVLAIGVIGFGVLIVLGLMPVGLNTMRQAMDNSTEMQIVKQITGEALLTPFSRLSTNFSGKTFYYDEQGIKESTASDKTRYWAITSITSPGYPGSDNLPATTSITNSLKTLRLDLVTVPSANAVSKTTNTYNIKVPSSGN